MSATTASSTTHLPLFSPLAPLSTRILALSGFPPELKTRDIQAIFQTWEDDKGGFKIKWVDDTNALVIFNDPSVAKRAYLHTLMSPPASLISQTTGQVAKVRPYDGQDASGIIASVQNRPRSRSNTGGHAHTSSIDESSSATADDALGSSRDWLPSSSPHKHSGSIGRSQGSLLGHRRHQSGSNTSTASIAGLPAKPVAAALFDAAQGGPSPARHLANAAAAEKAAADAAATASANGASSAGVATHETLKESPHEEEEAERTMLAADEADEATGQQTPTRRTAVAA